MLALSCATLVAAYLLWIIEDARLDRWVRAFEREERRAA